ncbi:MAG TPA: hypothetical protein VK689_20155 [Armatimonadota bacterium]|nr:hypothetical protein [Armatimonadota bacterium]
MPVYLAGTHQGESPVKLPQGYGPDFHARVRCGRTSLHNARDWGSLTVAELLQLHGAAE